LVTVTRGVGGRDHLLWLYYRANVYSIMDDTPKTAGKSAKNLAVTDALLGQRGDVLAVALLLSPRFTKRRDLPEREPLAVRNVTAQLRPTD
jgi:hypothetical protein